MAHSESDNHTVLWRVPALDGLELLLARHTSHAFPRHYHDTYVIELVLEGTDTFVCRGEHHVAPAGSLVLIHPYEVHTGCPAGDGPLVYRSFYPGPQLLAGVSARPGAPCFATPVVKDREMVDRLSRAHEALEVDPESGAAADALQAELAELVRRHASPGSPAHDATESARMDRARAYVLDHFSEPLTVEMLARVAGLSTFRLVHAFKQRLGVPPHEYLVSTRIEHARELLRAGHALADVALDAGFADQSHLTRHFKRVVGVTPGRYAARAAQAGRSPRSHFVQSAAPHRF